MHRGALSFPNPIDMSIETSTGQVTIQFTYNDGKDRCHERPFRPSGGLGQWLSYHAPEEHQTGARRKPRSRFSRLPKTLARKLAIAAGGEERFFRCQGTAQPTSPVPFG
jgi:hypothetical protein